MTPRKASLRRTEARTPRAFSYLRFSTPEQQRGDSFRRQKDLAERYATQHELELDGSSFQDLGVSAFRGANAETGRLAEFLEAVREGLIPRGSYLLVESLDRLSRAKPRKALRLLEGICDAGVVVVTLADGREYTSETLDDDGLGLMFALMVAMRANEESATKSRRLRAAWEAKRAKPEGPISQRAVAWVALRGDRSGFDLVPERADVVRRIFREYLAGVGPHSIAERLNRDGVPPFGRAEFWHRSYVVKILGNEAAIGTFTPHTLEHDGGRKRRIPQDPRPGYYPAAIDPEDFAKVQAMRAGRNGPRSPSSIAHLLAGLARCPKCGGTMVRVNKGPTTKGGRYLVCAKAKAGAGCEYKACRVEVVEKAIERGLGRLREEMPKGSPTLLDLERRLVVERNGLEAEIVRWLDELARGPSSAASGRLRRAEEKYDRATADLGTVRLKLRSLGVIARPQRMVELEKAVRGGEAQRAQANAFMRLLFDGVTVDPSQGRLRFAWKQGGFSDLAMGEADR